MQALSDMLKGNTVLTDLDMSENYMDATDAKIFSEGISDNGALLVVSLESNSLGPAGGKALAEGLKGNQVITELNIANNSLGHTYGGGGDMSGVVALADAILDMGAISSINLLKNQIPVKQAQELVKIMQAKEKLATLCGLSRDETELDFSGQYLGAGDAVLIANDISDMRALTSLNLAQNDLGQMVPPEGWRAEDGDGQAPWIHTDGTLVEEGMPEGSKPEAIIAVANAIPDMRALSIANVMGNSIGKEMRSKLQEIMHSNPNLVSLCGIADDATEADLSGLGMDADDAIILASELPNKRALSSLNLANNMIGRLSCPEGWQTMNSNGKQYFKTATQNWATDLPPGAKPEGVIALANAIPDMRALAKLVFSGDDNSKSVTMETTMTVADFSGKGLGKSGAIMLSAFLPKCM
jgi:hypothetical protein